MTEAGRAAADVADVAEARTRMRERPTGADRWSALALGGGLVALALAAAALLPWQRDLDPLALVLLVALHAVASRVEIEVGPGAAVATEVVLVPMLFILPLPLVPLAVVAGMVLGGVVDHVVRDAYRDRLLVLAAFAWHAVGPAAVLLVAGVAEPSWEVAPVLALAFLAQLALDCAAALLRDCAALGAPVRAVLRALATAWTVDVLLAPIGLAAAVAGGLGATVGIAGAAVLLVLLLAVERRRALDRAVVLGNAYSDEAARARLDTLTGLANRLAWDEALVAARESGAPTHVVVLDVDGLKAANDQRGHLFGDRLLMEVAGALRVAVPRAACLARLGGDEFAVLLTGRAAATGAEVAAALAAALDGHRRLDGFAVVASVGAASAAADEDPAGALAAADRAAYAVKARRGALRGGSGRPAVERLPFVIAPS